MKRYNETLFLIVIVVRVTTAQMTTVRETIENFNSEYNIELNIFLNGPVSQCNDGKNILSVIETPKLILNHSLLNITAIGKYATGNCLTIVKMDNENGLMLLSTMEKLLWKLHFKNILIIWQRKDTLEVDTDADGNELAALFKQCWTKGFINVVVWFKGSLMTYKPYPKIEKVYLPDFQSYRNRLHLHNFQQYTWHLPFVQFAPRCYSFQDRRGNLIRTGYMYKLVDLFVKHQNGTFNITDVDMWSTTLSQNEINIELPKLKFSFLPTASFYSDAHSASDVLLMGSSRLLVPAPNEISSSLYFLLPFTAEVWLINLAILLFIMLLIYATNLYKLHIEDRGKIFLQALATITFLPYVGSTSKSFLNYMLYLLPLLTGLLLTNFYNCNLSSMLTSKIFEQPLKSLEDIAKIDQSILEHSVDVEFYKNYDLPAIIYDRLYSGNNTILSIYRKKLDFSSYIYSALDDVSSFLLLQQKYLKKPIAKLLDEPTTTRMLFIAMPHRSPLIDHFNRYLLYVKDGGIMQKLIRDSEWDGIRTGEIKFFIDPVVSKSLTLAHFQYAFVIWSCGLIIAALCFLKEILWK